MTWLACAGWLLAAWLALLVLGMRRRLEGVARAEHELRGPLAALALAVEQVRRGRAGPELAGMLEAQLERSRAGLRDLTAALGGGSARRPGHGRAAWRGRVSLERLARQTAAGWAGVAAHGGRSLRLDWCAGPAPVAADRGRLAQALGNLLSNAIEHGDGEVELRGRRVGDAIRIEVADRAGAGRTEVTARGAKRIEVADRGGAGRLEVTDRGPAGRIARAAARRMAVSRRGSRRRYGARPGRGRGLGIATSAVEESGGTLEIVKGRAGTTAALELPLEDR